MAKAKVKSREEKFNDDIKKYFQNVETIEKLDNEFMFRMKEIIVKTIKHVVSDAKLNEILHEYSKEKYDKNLLLDIRHNAIMSEKYEYIITKLNNKLNKDAEVIIKTWKENYKKGNGSLYPILKQYNHVNNERFISDFKDNNRQEIENVEEILIKFFSIINSLEKENEKFKENQEHPKNFSYISLENFKGFSNKNTIPIKPITLIYGPNSYGKSSILQSLLLLSQTLKEGKDSESINLLPNGNMVKLGSFSDFINKNNKDKKLKIELSLPYKIYDYSNKRIAKISICYNYSNKEERIILSRIEIYKEEFSINSTLNEDNEKILIGEFEVSNEDSNKYYQIKTSSHRKNEEKVFYKKSFFKISDFSKEYYDEKIFDDVERIISNITYVSSYRTPPERYYVAENNPRFYVGKNGQYTMEIIYDKDVRKYLNTWLEKIADYKLPSKKNSKVNSVTLDDNKTKVKNINILDLGSGIAQVLPIITQSFKSENEMILIEEPEIHLHPKAQAELGEMFAKAAETKGNTFIIETHSENLLLRLEKLIRRRELSKDDVSVIYVDKDASGSYCIPLELDDEGDIININEVPDGFFEEGFNELFDIKNNKE